MTKFQDESDAARDLSGRKMTSAQGDAVLLFTTIGLMLLTVIISLSTISR